MRSRRKNRGSVVLLVVGLLTIIAMLGSTFVLVARLDRRQSRAIADDAPTRGVADGVLALIVQDRLDDLYLSGNGPYGTATKVTDLIDAAHDDADRVLASNEIEGANWRHISNIGDFTGSATNVAQTGLVDTDGDTIRDARLWDSRITNGRGDRYYVAVRVIDASGLVNANTAYSSAVTAQPDMILPLSSVSLFRLASGTYTAIHAERRGTTSADIVTYEAEYSIRPLNPVSQGANSFLPFDMSDMLAIAWRENGASTAQGRLFTALGPQFNTAKGNLTVWSASRVYIPTRVTGDTAQVYKADLNEAGYNELFNAFFNAIPRGVSGLTSGGSVAEQDRRRKLLAAQLAVNTIDFTDSNDSVTPTTQDSRGSALISADNSQAVTVYGVERQVFVTEAFGKRYKEMPSDPAEPPIERYYWAVELFNPYTTSIDLSDYKITSAAGEVTLSGTIPAGKFVVLASTETAADITVHSTGTKKSIALDLSGATQIHRTVAAPGSKIVIANIPAISLPDPAPPAGSNAKKTKNIFWHDTRKDARYTRTITREVTDSQPRDYTSKDGGTSTAGDTYLGRANPSADLPNENLVPCPVYVRNGKMISLGDLCRILYVGPTQDKSLREQLGHAGGYAIGRLDPAGGANNYGNALIPNIPPGALLGNYVMVGSPLADKTSAGTPIDNDGDGQANNLSNVGEEDIIFGRINANTAPSAVLMSMGGVGQLVAASNRQAIANEIISYRNSSTVGGFASPAEVAIPVLTAGGSLTGGWALPLNMASSNSAPGNYALYGANDDDGLSTSGADRIEGDIAKHHVYYSWLSNHVTVRSDVYIAYIRVQIGDSTSATRGVRHYVAVVDRSNCRTSTERPIVRMFARAK